MPDFELLKQYLEDDEDRQSHAWLYGQDFVRCIMCGAETIVDSMKPCPGFGAKPCVRD